MYQTFNVYYELGRLTCTFGFHLKHIMVFAGRAVPTPATHNDFTPLKLACPRDGATPSPRPATAKPVSSVHRSMKPNEYQVKPPVPSRPKKFTDDQHNLNHGLQDVTMTERLAVPANERLAVPAAERLAIPVAERLAVPAEPKVPPKRAPFHKTKETVVIPQSSENSHAGQFRTNDIVLPPPPQFQEGSGLPNQQPSYGDYELLSPDSSYPCNVKPTVTSRRSPSVTQNGYHHRVAVDQLQTNLRDKLNVASKSNKPQTNVNGLGYSPYYSNGLSSHDTRSKANQRTRFVSHQCQYSTEL